MKSFFQLSFTALYKDEYNRIAVLLSTGGALIAYLLWYKLSSLGNFSFFSPYSYYPLEMFAMIFILHLIISIYSYEIDKNISHLLTSSAIFFSLLIIILEFYYWSNL